ncbi:hypothetical protein Tco_0097821 [Tanacetum coccineum]
MHLGTRLIERAQRLEEEVHGLCDSIMEQHILLERMSSDHDRLSTWVVDRITQLKHQSGLAFPRFDERLVGNFPLSMRDRSVDRGHIGDASTSAAPHARTSLILILLSLLTLGLHLWTPQATEDVEGDTKCQRKAGSIKSVPFEGLRKNLYHSSKLSNAAQIRKPSRARRQRSLLKDERLHGNTCDTPQISETDIQEKNKKKAKSKQFQARSRKGQSQKSDKARKYNFGGPKLPKPQVVLQKRKTRVKIAKKCMRNIVLQARRLRQQQLRSTTVPRIFLRHPIVFTMADNRTMAELLQAPTE